MHMNFTSAWTDSQHAICSRCDELDLISILDGFPPWHSQDEQSQAVSQRNESVHCLGKTGITEFWADCDVCRCLFALTPNPSSMEQDILLVPDWTLCRVTGEFGAVLDAAEKRQYATCLVVALDPSSHSLPFSIRAHRGDAMCLVADDLKDGRTLGGRELQRNGVDVNLVNEWIRRCSRLHGAHCAPVLTDELAGIRLLDVQNRRIVKFPDTSPDYIAASYVWGGIPAKQFKLGDTVGPLPTTLEDMLFLAKLLGKRYLWTDYVCIDQFDEDEKADQIARMWSIYRGAYITIFAMPGTSADSGLSGLSRQESFSQLACQIKGRRLVGTFPTFSQEAWVTPWATRAWTLQEGYLSPRCLFFTDHQMYFDCSAMLCCETLNHSDSWAHNLTEASNTTGRPFLAWITDQIGAGGYRMPLRDPAKRLETWGVKLNMYSYRDMTSEKDALRAFDGIAQQLRSIYPAGFLYGLPIEDFDWGLLWRSQWPPTRRAHFPSWTWAGWKGGLWFGQPFDATQTRAFSVHLNICSMKGGQSHPVFKTEHVSLQHHLSRSPPIVDPIQWSAQSPPEEELPVLDAVPEAEVDGVLIIDAVCLHFVPDFSRPRTSIESTGQFEIFDITVAGVNCMIYIISVDEEINRPKEVEVRDTLILIARDSIQDLICHHLLLIRYHEGSNLAHRVTTFQLLVPYEGLIALATLKPCRRRILLA